jgi:hypothetical protein
MKSNRDCLKGFRFRHENLLRTGYNSLKGSTKLQSSLMSKSFFLDVKIDNSYRSDHSPVIFSFKINELMKGKGLWKFTNFLLHETEYVKLVKKQIKYVKEQ